MQQSDDVEGAHPVVSPAVEEVLSNPISVIKRLRPSSLFTDLTVELVRQSKRGELKEIVAHEDRSAIIGHQF